MMGPALILQVVLHLSWERIQDRCLSSPSKNQITLLGYHQS